MLCEEDLGEDPVSQQPEDSREEHMAQGTENVQSWNRVRPGAVRGQKWLLCAEPQPERCCLAHRWF